MTARIVARGLARSFGDKQAVHPFDLEVGAGITGLLGPNGSGKSTFLRMLTGLVPPDAGTAVVAGEALEGDGTAIRRATTTMPGTSTLYTELTGRRHLKWLLRGRPRAALARALEVAAEFGLPLHKRVRTYSHGMTRQLLLAAALGPDVPVRILDEPTEGLDPTRRAQVLALLRAEAERDVCVLLSSHHLGEVDRACGRILFLSEGRLLADQDSDALRERMRRMVRVVWPTGTEAERFVALLERWGARDVKASGCRATALLADGDPRPFLSALGGDPAAPRPEQVVYGEVSLAELYRDLYGVEGV